MDPEETLTAAIEEVATDAAKQAVHDNRIIETVIIDETKPQPVAEIVAAAEAVKATSEQVAAQAQLAAAQQIATFTEQLNQCQNQLTEQASLISSLTSRLSSTETDLAALILAATAPDLTPPDTSTPPAQSDEAPDAASQLEPANPPESTPAATPERKKRRKL